MLSYVQILLLTMGALAITDTGVASNIVIITNGCYKIDNNSTCPPEIKGYVPVSAGPDDVFLLDPYGNIVGPGQQQQVQGQLETIQQIDPGKGGTVPIQQGDPTQTTGGGGALPYRQ